MCYQHETWRVIKLLGDPATADLTSRLWSNDPGDVFLPAGIAKTKLPDCPDSARLWREDPPAKTNLVFIEVALATGHVRTEIRLLICTRSTGASVVKSACAKSTAPLPGR